MFIHLNYAFKYNLTKKTGIMAKVSRIERFRILSQKAAFFIYKLLSRVSTLISSTVITTVYWQIFRYHTVNSRVKLFKNTVSIYTVEHMPSCITKFLAAK